MDKPVVIDGCAGCGKTTTIANRVLVESKVAETVDKTKKIYVLSYTNNSVADIIDTICKSNNGFVPSNIIIQTIHEFLLHEVIYPYSSILYTHTITNCSIQIIKEEKIQFENYRKRLLKENGYIHVDDVFNAAKQIFSNSKKMLKKLLPYFTSTIYSIYIDEIQDIDEDIVDLVKLWCNNSIKVFCVGDRKQALSQVGNFEKLIDYFKEKEFNYETHNESWRCPNEHIQLSNKFLFDDEAQEKSGSKEKGTISYIFESSSFFEVFMSNLYEMDDKLIFIKSKYGRFTTKRESKRGIISDSYLRIYKKKLMKDQNVINIDAKIFETEALILEKMQQNIDQDVVLCLIQRSIGYKPLYNKACTEMYYEQKKIIEEFYSEQKTECDYYVNSIQSIKGLQSSNCVFILDNSMSSLLFGVKKITKNKERNLLYVGLTRSSKNLVFVIPKLVELKIGLQEITNYFNELGVNEYKLDYPH